MQKHRLTSVTLLAALMCLSSAASAAELVCRMQFSLSSWSVFYKRTTGEGTIKCTDGSTLKVKLTANGGGMSVGQSKIKDGVGKFTGLATARDILGTYAQADSTLAAGQASTNQVLTKGSVSMYLSGKGEGVTLGIAIGGMTIEEAK
ncbi:MULTISPECIES: hypothetical protein [Dyella]|uniref:Uncharacterized protein n=2 Tax=Dyella TaxID=231454 RepID=A0A4R0Z1L5_9GAMM|nr:MULTISPECIES: hypothetical protein [Dyella]TBR39346.1 hypothetical protein EYV96_03735 [Dyella terrae]TCI13066.1 hypothetical protein EZM97_07130 [Dyella soli]